MSRVTLAQGKLGPVGLWIMAVVASSPLTVQVGGIPTMYAATAVVGTPLAFLVVGAVLFVLASPYVAASAHIKHAAPLYALLARGLSPVLGVAGGAVALVGYVAIGTSLYGLVGVKLAGLSGFDGPWWAWALGVWLLVALLGMLGGLNSARLLGALLALELAVITFYVITALVHRTDALTLQPLTPAALMVPGMSGAIAFAMAAFVGVETVPAYVEEARGGARTLRRATLSAVVFASLFYALGSWAMAIYAGPAHVSQAAADPGQGPLETLGYVFGPGMTVLATMLLVTSVIAAMTSFHHAGARYLFAMAREGVLVRRLTVVSKLGDGGTPVMASLLQTVFAGAVIGGFVLAQADPMGIMFAWLSTIGAVALLTLLVVAAGAAYGFFARGQGTNDSIWVRRIAPVTGCVLGVLLMVMMLANLGALLGLPPGSRRWLLVPAFVAAVCVGGLLWGLLVLVLKPAAGSQIGRVVADPVSSPVTRLRKLVM